MVRPADVSGFGLLRFWLAMGGGPVKLQQISRESSLSDRETNLILLEVLKQTQIHLHTFIELRSPVVCPSLLV